VLTNCATLYTVFNTLIPLSRELWPMIDCVMRSLATRYTTPDTTVEIGTTGATVK